MTPSGFQLGPSSTVRFSDDGTYLASLRGRISLWDVSDRRRVASGPRFPHASSADFSPDGTLLAVKNTTGDVLVLSIPGFDEISRLSGRDLGEGTPIRFAEDGKYIVDATWGGALMVRDPISGALAWSERGASVFRLERSRDRAVWTYDRNQLYVRSWPFDAHEPKPISFWGPPFSVALSDDGTRVAGISAGLEVAEQHADGTWSASHQAFPAPWDGAAHGLCWGPGDELIHAHHSTVRVFEDVRSPPRLTRLPFPARDIAVSPAAGKLAVGGWDEGLLLDWPLASTTDVSDAPPPA
ncbi:WD40 repeat domain-containing protein [Solirubrobacter taibaiensis]|nr:WD40 repeat domain-containing protein [Solirubrobacter taibaiensis]